MSAEEYYKAVIELIEYYKGKYKCCGVAFSCQLHCFLLCNRDGKLITNLITWQDTRANEIVVQNKSVIDYLSELLGESFYERTGTNIKLGLPLCAFYHYYINNGVEPNTTFFTLDSYIMWRLLGKNICHTSIAAATGFYNIYDKSWDEEIVRYLDLPKLVMPIATEEYCCVGEYEEMKIFPAIGDQQATICGIVGGKKEEVNIISIGTAGLASRISDQPSNGDYEIRPYIEGLYLLTVRRQIGGRNFDVLTKLVSDIGEKVFGCTMEHSGLLQRLAELIPKDEDNPLEMEMKFFDGQIGVSNGRIDNIRADNFNIGSILRAACVSTAISYKNAISRLDPLMKDEVIVAGKIFRTWDYLQTIFGAVFDERVRFADVTNDSLWGIMYMIKGAK